MADSNPIMESASQSVTSKTDCDREGRTLAEPEPNSSANNHFVNSTTKDVKSTEASEVPPCHSTPAKSNDPERNEDQCQSVDVCKDVFSESRDAKDISNMKVDDSGIDMGKSLLQDDGDVSLIENETGGLKIRSSDSPEADSMREDHPSTSNESDGLIAEFVDAENTPPSGANEQMSCAADSDTNDNEGGSTRAQDNDSDDDDDNEDSSRTRRHHFIRRRIFRHSSSSSSTTGGADTPDDSNDEDDAKFSDCQDSMETDDKVMPQDPWNPYHEVRRREYGYSNHLPMADIFRRHTGSSIQLAQRLKRQTKLEFHDGCVNALHFNMSGTLLASGSDDLNVVLWNWAHNKRYLHYDSGHRSNVFQAKFMPYTGDCHVVSCARDGQVRLAELSSTGICKGTKKLAQHRGAAHKLALLQDSSHMLYSCGEDAVVFEIDLRESKPNKLSITKENDRKVALYSIQANPSKSHEFCVGGRDHYIRIYDKRMLQSEEDNPLKKFCPHHLVNSDVKANVTCAVYNFNGTEVLGTYNDEDIYLFDNTHSDGAEYIRRYSGHRNKATVKGVNFYGPESEFIVSGSDCGNVFLWEKQSEKIVNYFHADQGGVINVLEPHPHAPVLATSGLDHDIKIWAPSAKEANPLGGLKMLVKRNTKEREEERESEPDMIDGQMLWLLMQHLRRTSRRRARREGENLSSSSSNSDNNDSDDSEEMREPVQCVPS